MPAAIMSLFSILIFPGMLFLMVFGLAAEYIDRKLHARLQNRVGPPWFQPLADFIKLASKEEILPSQASAVVFKLMPVVAFTAILTAVLYIPMWGAEGLYSFQGDLVVVLYLLTIPTLTFFMAGWYSGSTYSMLGAARSIMQLFAYEVPLFLGILGPSILANTWQLSGVIAYYTQHPERTLFNVIGLFVSLIALLGKLEKVPFDIPEAETEIVAGSFTEYSGRLLAMFRMALDVEMVVGATLLAAVFLPFGMNLPFAAAFVVYILRVLVIIVALSILRTIFARLRIDQMIDFCWKYIAPLAFVQVLIDLALKGALGR